MDEIEEHYTYDNVVYSIITTREVHNRLQNDPQFFNTYLPETINSHEAVGIAQQQTDPQSTQFIWTRENTQLLLEKYSERRTKFRDPKIKKKELWTEIVKEFQVYNYNVKEDILDRKMRNLKQSFKNIKDNNKRTSTGRGRISWEWYDTMEEIFRDDKTINFGATISSMTPVTTEGGIVQRSFSPIPSSFTFENNISKKHVANDIEENMSKKADNIEENIHKISSNNSECTEIMDLTNISSIIPQQGDSSSSDNLNMFPKDDINQKRTRMRGLYKDRKRQLEVEEKRLDELRLIREEIKENNIIQKQRNEILLKLVEAQTRQQES